MTSRPVILNPCPADWNAMAPAERGRHCSLCSKTVVDFTQATDEEILNALRTSGQKVCGRMHTHTPNPKPFLNPELTLGKWAWRRLQVFVLALVMVFAGQSCIFTPDSGDLVEVYAGRVQVAGFVRHLNGTDTLPATGATISLMYDSATVYRSTTADSIGAYSFLNLYADGSTFQVKAEYEGTVQFRQFVAGQDADIIRFDFIFD